MNCLIPGSDRLFPRIKSGHFHIKCCCTLLFFILIYPQYLTLAQNSFNFEHISTFDGLSTPIVHQIISDKYGFLWIATPDGLNKYDGYSFKIFRNKINDKNSLSNNNISTICEYDGKIWTGTWGGGINKFDGNKNFTHFRSIQSDSTSLIGDYIQFLFKDKNNTLWVCTTTGLDRFNSRKNTFDHFLKDSRILSIAEDKDGKLYAGTWETIYVLDEKREAIKKIFIPKKNVTEIFVDHRNEVWVGTDNGLFTINRQTEELIPFNWKSYLSDKAELLYIKAIFEDSNNDVWIGTQKDGILKISRKERKTIHFDSQPDNTFRIGFDNIYHFHEDKSKILWISTIGSGIHKLDLKPQKFKHYTHVFNNHKSLSHNLVRSFYEDSDGTMFVGTSIGLNKFNRKTSEFEFIKFPETNSNLSKAPINAIYKDKSGIFWIGTDKYRWFTYDYKNNRILSVQNDLDYPEWIKIYDGKEIVKDKNGNIWIGTNNGLIKKDFNTGKIILYDKLYGPARLSASNLNSLYADSDGIIWAGTGDGGLNRLDPIKDSIIVFRHDINNKNTLSNDNIFGITETDNYIWAGTPFGLNRINKKTFRVERYMEDAGLVSLHISKILADNEGNIWLATSVGLSKFNPVTNKFVNYNKYNGLQNNEFNWTCCFKTKDGELFFGSIDGFISFYPNLLTKNTSIPAIAITSLKVFNEEKDLGARMSELKEIELDYSENRISFEFASLDYTSPQSNRFMYQLVGFDKEWVFADDRRYANYTNLDPGIYIFKVIGSNNDNVWNQTGASIKLTIVPPFWQTLWFRVLSLCSVLILGFVGFKMKVRNIEKSKVSLEKLNEQLTVENKERKQAEDNLREAKEMAEKSDKLKSEFLAQMSHEIRSPINTMFNFTELLKEEFNLTEDKEKKDIFDSIERAGVRIIRTIDLILNMSEIQTGSYECVYKDINLSQKISSIVNSDFIYKAKKKDITLSFQSTKKDFFVNADSYSLEQIFVNLLDNAIKYTQKGEIKVFIYFDEEKKICVDVSDTGIGISEKYLSELFKPFSQEEQGYSRKYEGSGLGLALVKKYCEINNAEIFVKSKKNKGTTFTVRFK